MVSSTSWSHRPARRSFVLLVMTVLTGVLGMHGLAPGGALPTQAHATHATHAMAAGHAADALPADIACSHGLDGPHHLAHADGTCAAAGVTVPYTPPTPDTGPVGPPSDTSMPAKDMASTDGGRAPPDLSELQLLRV
ncbi:DUF6153 family protein [Streptomyces sp. MJP52]|uniref:DUF6153 family protein n=1 Tax=Streptomyces sp. MJP52 TaxID=2940555 RepID=UPI002475BC71|nr:DUF6153 family protein [Streptomyces sp. MJP52]MDH6223986.1 hypothetical protein [Streptomyces sp. MJP52]